MNWTTGDTRAVGSLRPYRGSSTVAHGDVLRRRHPTPPPPPAPQNRNEAVRAEGTSQGGAPVAPRGRRREERGGQAVSNPRPIQRLRLLPGENTWGICREVALPTLGGVAF